MFGVRCRYVTRTCLFVGGGVQFRFVARCSSTVKTKSNVPVLLSTNIEQEPHPTNPAFVFWAASARSFQPTDVEVQGSPRARRSIANRTNRIND